jgi:hypothetical protein
MRETKTMRLMLSEIITWLFHPNNLRLLLWMLESLEGCFGGFLAQEVIGIEIMRRRKTEGDVSTFCVCEIFLRGHCQQTIMRVA